MSYTHVQVSRSFTELCPPNSSLNLTLTLKDYKCYHLQVEVLMVVGCVIEDYRRNCYFSSQELRLVDCYDVNKYIGMDAMHFALGRLLHCFEFLMVCLCKKAA